MISTIKLDFRNQPPQGKQYVIGDIHGYAHTFKQLIAKISLKKHDQLFLLGDYINRGPRSREVIDAILDLQRNGFQVFPLKGNHEDMAMQGRLLPEYGMTDEQDNIIEPYKSFFDSLIYFVEMDDRYLSHAGFNFTVPNPFEDYKRMYWTMKIRLGHTSTTHKQLIYGHISHSLIEIRQAIAENRQLIPLDNGVYKSKDGFGHLCALELTAWELFVQKQIG